MALGSSTGAGRVHEWLPFQVDCWELADQQGGQSKPGFLTHAHTDHTHGIEAWARQQGGASFFCSEDTWRLMLLRNPSLGEASRRRGGLEVQHVEPLEPCSVSWGGQSFEVVALDANHCQGALMYIFQGSFGTVLHTGDCRLTESVVARLRHYLAKLGIERLDLVYLDCTFASYPKDFPSTMDAVRHVKDLIQMPQGHRRFYIACEGLGREPLLKALAEKWKQPIFVPRNINEGIGFHGEQSPKQRLEELRILLPPWMITSDPQANLHVCGGRELPKEAAKLRRSAKAAGLQPPLVIRPSVQAFHVERCLNMTSCETKAARTISHGALVPSRALSNLSVGPVPTGKHMPGQINSRPTPQLHTDRAPLAAELKEGVMTGPAPQVWHVLYSLHSSLRELVQAMQALQPKLVVPHSASNSVRLHPALSVWCGSSDDIHSVLRLTAPTKHSGHTQNINGPSLRGSRVSCTSPPRSRPGFRPGPVHERGDTVSIKQDSAGQASPARKHRNDVFPGGAVISVGSTCLPTTESALSTAFTIGGSYGGLYGMSAVPVVGLEESEGACNALKAQRGGAAECPEDHGETGMDKRGLEPVAEGGPALKKVLVDAMVKMDQSCPQGGSGVCRVGTEVQPNKCRDEAPFRPGKLRTETGADQSRLYRALGNRFLPPPIRRWQDI